PLLPGTHRVTPADGAATERRLCLRLHRSVAGPQHPSCRVLRSAARPSQSTRHSGCAAPRHPGSRRPAPKRSHKSLAAARGPPARPSSAPRRPRRFAPIGGGRNPRGACGRRKNRAGFAVLRASAPPGFLSVARSARVFSSSRLRPRPPPLAPPLIALALARRANRSVAPLLRGGFPPRFARRRASCARVRCRLRPPGASFVRGPPPRSFVGRRALRCAWPFVSARGGPACPRPWASLACFATVGWCGQRPRGNPAWASLACFATVRGAGSAHEAKALAGEETGLALAAIAGLVHNAPAVAPEPAGAAAPHAAPAPAGTAHAAQRPE